MHLKTLEFQFTLPRGERRLVMLPISVIYGFNSRSRGGSDKTFNFNIRR